jgi:PIN domain nuclease of toxin-antitoxin system
VRRRHACSIRDEHAVLLSAVVVREAAITAAIGELDAPPGLGPLLTGAGARGLPIRIDHAEAVREPPMHHRDPFDRLPVAQALTERAILVGADPAFDAYGVLRIRD